MLPVGALVVLSWCFSGSFIFLFLYYQENTKSKINLPVLGSLNINSFAVPSLLLYCFFGWLADAKFGRYKVIKWSWITLWIFSAIFCILSILDYYHLKFSKTILVLGYLSLSVVLGGVLANILQFGMDQLAYASSSEIKSFFRWLLWLWFLSDVLLFYSMSCLGDYKVYSYLILPVVTTFALCLDFLFGNSLVKEPPSSDSFRIIFKVLTYARKNKYPKLTAISEWDQKKNSRLDVGKRTFGGPFTMEQVEDVKSFVRIVVIILVVTLFCGLYVPVFQEYYYILERFYNSSNKSVGSCFSKVTTILTGDLIVLIGIPAYEFFKHPLLRKYLSFSILSRAFMGLLFAFCSVTSGAVILAVAQPFSHTSLNSSSSCSIFNNSSLSLDYRWMAIPFSLDSFMQFLQITAGVEFICAQSPFAMKGFLFGVMISSMGLFTIVGSLFTLGVQRVAERWLLFYPHECTFWYLTLNLLVFLVVLVVSAIFFKCYKRRQRVENDERLSSVSYYL